MATTTSQLQAELSQKHYEQELQDNPSPFVNTLYYQGSPVPYTPDEIETLIITLLPTRTLAQSGIGLTTEEEALYNSVLLEEFLRHFITQPTKSSPLGLQPRAKLKALLGHDVVDTFKSRGDQTPKADEIAQKIYRLSVELVQEKRFRIDLESMQTITDVNILEEKRKKEVAEEQVIFWQRAESTVTDTANQLPSAIDSRTSSDLRLH